MNASRRSERGAPGVSLGVPVEELVRLIRGRYKPDILIRLGKVDRLRFAQLRRAIPGLSDRALARQLDELERDGLIERTVYPEVPARVEYTLTPLGHALCPLIKQMWKWSVQHLGGRRAHAADH
jgi:DNA-binding HxlR family transcriptional regulator